jgi:hypothetical protein
MPTSNPSFAQIYSVYPYDYPCLKNNIIGSLERYINQLEIELANYSTESSTKNLGVDQDCSNQIINTNSILDEFANAFFDNIELNNSVTVSFSKIFDLLIHPTLIVTLFSIVLGGLVLNSLKKLNKSTTMVRKGFSQLTRARILRKQNYRCVYCRKALMVIDYHHKNGNRSDNRENNCQALCPNCHAIKTRKN